MCQYLEELWLTSPVRIFAFLLVKVRVTVKNNSIYCVFIDNGPKWCENTIFSNAPGMNYKFEEDKTTHILSVF